MKRGVFISYRRTDSASAAGRIRDRLTQELGPGRVFMDVSDIAPGTDFEEAIKQRISNAAAVVAIIGPAWSTDPTSTGELERVGKPDYVRQEIRAALYAGIPVIPVLIDDAEMPSAADLPASLKKLAKINALEIRHSKFDSDVSELVEILKDFQPGRSWAVPTAIGAVVVMLVVFAMQQALRSDDTAASSPQTQNGDTVPVDTQVTGNNPSVLGNTDNPQTTRPSSSPPEPTASVQFVTSAPAAYYVLQSGTVIDSGNVTEPTWARGIPAGEELTLRLIWRDIPCSPAADTLWERQVTLETDEELRISTVFNCS